MVGHKRSASLSDQENAVPNVAHPAKRRRIKRATTDSLSRRASPELSQVSPRKPRRKGARALDEEEEDTPPFFPHVDEDDVSRQPVRKSLAKCTQDDEESVKETTEEEKTLCRCGYPSSAKFITPSLAELRRRAAAFRGKLNWIHWAEQKASAVVTRASLVNFLLHCTRQIHNVSPYTFHLAIATMDRSMFRIMRLGTKYTKEKLERDHRILAASALTLASRMEDVFPVQVRDIVVASRKMFTPTQVRLWENRILQVLDFELNVPTTLDFLQRVMLEERSALEAVCWNCHHDRELPSFSVFDLGKDVWHPSFAEGRNKSAVEAISAYVAEVFIAHPVSLSYTYDAIAAAVVKVVVAVLLDTQKVKADVSLADLFPASLAEIVDQDVDHAAKALSSVLVVYFEHSLVSVKTTKSNFGRINESLRKWAPDVDAPLMQEALLAETSREKACKLTVYLRVWCHERRIDITFSDAAEVVHRFLLDGGRDDLGDHLAKWQLSRKKSTSGQTYGQSPPEPIQEDVMKVRVQQPTEQTEEFPMGYFAYDVNWKHLDAFRVFDDLFRQWSQDRSAVASLEPSGMARDALARAQEQHDVTGPPPTPKGKSVTGSPAVVVSTDSDRRRIRSHSVPAIKKKSRDCLMQGVDDPMVLSAASTTCPT